LGSYQWEELRREVRDKHRKGPVQRAYNGTIQVGILASGFNLSVEDEGLIG
jgi:hypothetical protein